MCARGRLPGEGDGSDGEAWHNNDDRHCNCERAERANAMQTSTSDKVEKTAQRPKIKVGKNLAEIGLTQFGLLRRGPPSTLAAKGLYRGAPGATRNACGGAHPWHTRCRALCPVQTTKKSGPAASVSSSVDPRPHSSCSRVR